MEIVPEFRKNEFLELIKDGLQDVSISRPRKNLSWGVPVPGDPEQVMYVWLDALSNYITVLGYPERPAGKNIGRQTCRLSVRTFCASMRAFGQLCVLGLELPLPKKLMVHGHVNVGGVKQSKSLGNGLTRIRLLMSMALMPSLLLLSHIPTLDDGDFTWEKFENAYNNELGNDLATSVARC